MWFFEDRRLNARIRCCLSAEALSAATYISGQISTHPYMHVLTIFHLRHPAFNTTSNATNYLVYWLVFGIDATKYLSWTLDWAPNINEPYSVAHLLHTKCQVHGVQDLFTCADNETINLVCKFTPLLWFYCFCGVQKLLSLTDSVWVSWWTGCRCGRLWYRIQTGSKIAIETYLEKREKDCFQI